MNQALANFTDSVANYDELRSAIIDGKKKSVLRGVPLRNPLNVESLSYFPDTKPKTDGLESATPIKTQTGEMYYSPMDGLYGDANTCALLKENYKCIVYDSCGWCSSLNECLPGDRRGPNHQNTKQCPKKYWVFTKKGKFKANKKGLNLPFDEPLIEEDQLSWFK